MRIVLILTLLAGSLSPGCGGGPAPQTDDARLTPEAPDPDRANPCDATSIDPTENPCAGPAADAAQREAEAAMAAEGDRATGEAAGTTREDDDDEGAAAPQGTAGPGDEGTPDGAGAPAETTPEG